MTGVDVADFSTNLGCDRGLCGFCKDGYHHACGNFPGGIREHGMWMPETYLTVGSGPEARIVYGPRDNYSAIMVVRPSHRWFCPCGCKRKAPAPKEPVDLLELLAMKEAA